MTAAFLTQKKMYLNHLASLAKERAQKERANPRFTTMHMERAGKKESRSRKSMHPTTYPSNTLVARLVAKAVTKTANQVRQAITKEVGSQERKRNMRDV